MRRRANQFPNVADGGASPATDGRELPYSKVRYRAVRARPFVISLIGIAVIMFLTAASASDSGIQVTVTLGPTCPVERLGMRCERPYAASIAVYSESGRLVETARTTSDGRLRLHLSAGTYVLKPQPHDPARPYPLAKPVTVTVKPGSFATVKIQYDTGIR